MRLAFEILKEEDTENLHSKGRLQGLNFPKVTPGCLKTEKIETSGLRLLKVNERSSTFRKTEERHLE
jgi:hypothetical protein